MAQLVESPWGQVEFPDGMAPEEMGAAMDQFASQQTQMQQFNQLAPLARDLMRTFTPEATPNMWPKMPSSRALVGMRAEDIRGLAAMGQKQVEATAEQQMRERVEREKALEQEKDRQQQLKLEQMKFKNQQAEMKMRMEQREAELRQRMEADEAKQQAAQEGRLEIEEMRQKGTLAAIDRRASLGGYGGRGGGGGGGEGGDSSKVFATPQPITGRDGKKYMAVMGTDGTLRPVTNPLTDEPVEWTEENWRAFLTEQGWATATRTGDTLRPLLEPTGERAQRPTDDPTLRDVVEGRLPPEQGESIYVINMRGKRMKTVPGRLWGSSEEPMTDDELRAEFQEMLRAVPRPSAPTAPPSPAAAPAAAPPVVVQPQAPVVEAGGVQFRPPTQDGGVATLPAEALAEAQALGVTPGPDGTIPLSDGTRAAWVNGTWEAIQ